MGSRTVETMISTSNIQAEIETMLRRYKVLHDNEIMEGLEFGEIIEDCVRIKFQAVREEV